LEKKFEIFRSECERELQEKLSEKFDAQLNDKLDQVSELQQQQKKLILLSNIFVGRLI
jgi:hypothetical protein